MASQIAHIVYAKKYLEKYPSSEINRDEFLLGCVFPDIRRIAENLSRSETHRIFDPINLNFTGLNSFQAGWKFHLYCDMRREEILNKYGFYDVAGENGKSWQANKMLEDELLYDVYNNWEKLVHYFNNAPIIILPQGLSKESFSLWYTMVARYIEEKPTDKSMRLFISKQAMFQKDSAVIIEKVDKLRKNKKSVEILKRVINEIV
jgi:flagellar motor protein MotB